MVADVQGVAATVSASESLLFALQSKSSLRNSDFESSDSQRSWYQEAELFLYQLENWTLMSVGGSQSKGREERQQAQSEL